MTLEQFLKVAGSVEITRFSIKLPAMDFPYLLILTKEGIEVKEPSEELIQLQLNQKWLYNG